MASPFSRSRAYRLARRLAADALGRLARQVDRLTMALEPEPVPLPLHRTAPSTASRSASARPEAPPSDSEAEVLEVRPVQTTRLDDASTRSRDRDDIRGTVVTAPTPADVAASPIEPAHSDAEPAEPPPPRTKPIAPTEPPPSRTKPIASTPETIEPSPSRPPSVPSPASVAPNRTRGPSNPAEPVGLPVPVAQVLHLRRRIEPQIRLLRAHVGWEHDQDPVEALRRLRVATRRLRAFVGVFGPMLGPKRARRLRRRLPTVTRGVGPLREWDVLLEGLRRAHAAADPLLRAALEHVIAGTETQRDAAAKQARRAVAGVDVSGLADRLDRQLDRICGRMLRLDEQLPAKTWELLAPQLRRAFHQIPRPRVAHEVEALHDIRTRAKRLRYALELFKPTLGEAYRPLRKPTKRLQRTLGEHHDASLLAELLEQRRRELQSQGLVTLAQALESFERQLLARRHQFHEQARPSLEVLDAQRYAEIAHRALGVEPEPPAPSPDAKDDPVGEPPTTPPDPDASA